MARSVPEIILTSDVKEARARNAETPSGWEPEGVSESLRPGGLQTQTPPPAQASRYKLDHDDRIVAASLDASRLELAKAKFMVT